MKNSLKKLALYEYEQILLGNQSDFKVTFSRAGSEVSKKKIISFIWQYAIEEILNWTPQQALELLNIKIIKSLNLHKSMEQIGIKIEERRDFNAKHLLSIVYPNIIFYSFTDDVISEFKRINALDEYENNNTSKRFQDNYFAGSDGQKRAMIVFRYALNLTFGDKSVYEQYRFFAQSSEAKKWMRKNKIAGIMTSFYPEPLSCLHAALPIEQQNEVYYLNECLKNTPNLEELKRLMEKIDLTEKAQKINEQKGKKAEPVIKVIDLSAGFMV